MLLTPSVLEKLISEISIFEKKSIFEISIIPQTLNINN